MKTTAWSLVVATACILAAGCAAPGTGSGERIATPALEGGIEITPQWTGASLVVHGLSCPLCSNNLDGQLRRLAGLTDARIDLNTGVVTVRFAAGHALRADDLRKAVQDAGFTLKSIRPLKDQ